MKYSYIILILALFASNTFSQVRNIKTDTFYLSQDLMFSRLLLCSDSTFFIVTGGCVDAGISKGKWIRTANKILLNGVSECETELKTTITTQLFKEDSLVTFTFVDILNQKFANYAVVFFDSSFKETRLYTDINGIIKTKRGEYVAFYTQNEEQNVNIGEAINDKIHYLWNKLTRYTIMLNYPTSVLTDRGITEIYQFGKREFTVKGMELIDKKNKLIYKSN